MTDAATRPGRTVATPVVGFKDGTAATKFDDVATEEPLEIRIAVPGQPSESIAVTMRTPGADFELAAGFLFTEGIVAARSDIAEIVYCNDRDVTDDERYNVVTVTCHPEVRAAGAPRRAHHERHFTIGSACGACGKANLDALEVRGVTPVQSNLTVSAEFISSLPNRLRASQPIFSTTGGLHAAALFGADGEAIAVREDVGRHNALDKAIGWALLDDRVPLRDAVLLVSGRSSFEIVQKAVVAGIPIVASVSAPSSLAVETARRFNITLAGFVRDGRFNVYNAPERVS